MARISFECISVCGFERQKVDKGVQKDDKQKELLLCYQQLKVVAGKTANFLNFFYSHLSKILR
jgi:Zn ribbon nucleic-acid-binding protein